ncbi:MAG: DUF1684 domain-containing protein [Sediminibacterium sp.]|jgi:uncharacterized protein (DUF1684 family)|nr:DUF1684 domain-containing protein [Chitinophagaceae bacterium]MCA6447859.1 DUF1684 domain-containing protein [Chitinophagaceae bacterium]
MSTRKIIIATLTIIFSLQIGFTVAQVKNEYAKEIEDWKSKRQTNLKAENGWLNLAGLFWIEEGEQTFGSDSKNNFQFPQGKIPAVAGKIYRNNNTVYLIPEKSVDFMIDGKKVSDSTLIFGKQIAAPVIAYGSLRFSIIKRGDKLGIRLRDLTSSNVSNFKGIERFPTDSNWRVAASLIKNNPLTSIAITNVLGQTNETPYGGKIAFTINNVRYTLDAIDEGNDVLIVFGDKTTGKTTYHGGRFISIPKNQLSDSFYVDFNKAYNPPCVFTPYATCPLPPAQNILPIAVTAGEKNYGNH